MENYSHIAVRTLSWSFIHVEIDITKNNFGLFFSGHTVDSSVQEFGKAAAYSHGFVDL